MPLGDKFANVAVTVLPPPIGGDRPVEGEVRIEPANTILAPGQGDSVRVFVGLTDRTAAAKLTSSDPKVAMIQGDMVCALAPGNAEITATFPGSNATGKGLVTVKDEQITEVYAADSPMRLEVGDTTRLPVIGKAACGIHELFPQADLKLSAGGQNPAAIALPGGTWIKGVAVGEATVEMSWRDKIKGQVTVSVVNDPWGNLQIKPARRRSIRARH